MSIDDIFTKKRPDPTRAIHRGKEIEVREEKPGSWIAYWPTGRTLEYTTPEAAIAEAKTCIDHGK